MNLLLDACTFLWVVLDPSQLSATASKYFQDPSNICYLSSVSAWEIAVLHSLGRISLVQSPEVFVPHFRGIHGIETLELSEAAALQTTLLPMLHKDPFDRMLVCQALIHQLIDPGPPHSTISGFSDLVKGRRLFSCRRGGVGEKIANSVHL